jgi:hypothetical protein
VKKTLGIRNHVTLRSIPSHVFFFLNSGNHVKFQNGGAASIGNLTCVFLLRSIKLGLGRKDGMIVLQCLLSKSRVFL